LGRDRAPNKTPAEIIENLNKAVNISLADDRMTKGKFGRSRRLYAVKFDYLAPFPISLAMN
jgi:hypothetical protein